MSFWVVLVLLQISSRSLANEPVIEKLVRQVEEEKQALQEKEMTKRSILGDLYSVNKDLKKLNSDKSKVERGLKTAAENVEAMSRLIVQLEHKISNQRERLRARMKALSKVQGQGVARLVFASQSSGELDANLRIFRIITERDFRLLKAYRDNVSVLAAQKERLAKQEQKYAVLKKTLDKQERTLAEQVSKKSEMLKTVDTSRLLHLAKIKRLRLQSIQSKSNETELKKISALEDLLRPQLFERKGDLRPPVVGSIRQKYGLLGDEENTKIRFKGTLFEVKPGDRVQAIFAGSVKYSGWMKGYGRTVIIDHGDHYFSVYANLGELDVDEGDSVTEGHVLGSAASRASFLGEGLYFELRHFSEPEDPIKWLKSTASGDTQGEKI